MSNIKILDCTLRDGGYVNNWNFGLDNIKDIITSLVDSNIDIVECGFISDVLYNNDCTLFDSIKSIKYLLPKDKKHTIFVGMIALGEKEISYEKIEVCDENSITGIRLTFHQSEILYAFEFANNLLNKGYKVFMQPVGTMFYSDIELLNLIEKINRLNPFAFYIVDTLGSMNSIDLMRKFNLIDNNLNQDIQIGFHSHNNLQLSFSNSIHLINYSKKRQIIIDSTVLGMGRGAGNLCTELITQYLNDNNLHNYNLNLIFDIIDNHILRIKQKFEWGYSAPYYIAGINNCHPNYANFLINKRKLSSVDMNEILSSLPLEKKYIYDLKVIEKLYLNYNNCIVDDTVVIDKLKSIFQNSNIVILGAGKTIQTHQAIINDTIKNQNAITVSLNRQYDGFEQDYIFVSNLKKYNLYIKNSKIKNKIIITSNILTEVSKYVNVINYNNYLIKYKEQILDNVGLILLNLLSSLNVNKIFLAGFDGVQKNNNYDKNDIVTNIEEFNQYNKIISENIKIILSNSDYEFITPTIY